MDRVCFSIGGRPIYWYGVFMALAFLAAVAHWNLLARRQGRPAGFGSELGFWVLLSGILGARALYVVSEFGQFSLRPLDILRVDQGGLIFYGGLLGALLALVLLARRRGESFWSLADFTVTALPLGHAFGRVGCFLNGCCYGMETRAPWAAWSHHALRHPVQLYEAAANLMVYMALLHFILRGGGSRNDGTPGRAAGLYLMTYPAFRFLLEFLRGDERLLVAGLSAAQWFSLGAVALGLALWKGLPQRLTRARAANPPAP